METITSRQNPRYKEIKKLIEDKKYRDETGLFFVDGVNFVSQAVENNWEIEQLVYVPSQLDSDFKKRILTKIPTNKHFAVDISLYEALATKNEIQGVGAVVRQKLQRNTLLPGAGVVLENLANPGNLGSIARLCAAFEVKNLYVIKPAVEFFHPEAVRASMGAVFHLNLVSFDSLSLMKQEISSKNFVSLGTSLQTDSIDLNDYIHNRDNSKSYLIWFGSEAKGMSDEAKKLCQLLLRIPISQAVDSLNVAESAAVVLYELFIRK